MALVLIKEKISPVDFKKALQDYDSYIKITIDILKEAIVIGGEYHADAERFLLKQGSRQKNIWGGGVNLETGRFETNALINLRPGRNDSTEILDSRTREQFLKTARKIFRKYVK